MLTSCASRSFGTSLSSNATSLMARSTNAGFYDATCQRNCCSCPKQEVPFLLPRLPYFVTDRYHSKCARKFQPTMETSQSLYISSNDLWKASYRAIVCPVSSTRSSPLQKRFFGALWSAPHQLLYPHEVSIHQTPSRGRKVRRLSL